MRAFVPALFLALVVPGVQAQQLANGAAKPAPSAADPVPSTAEMISRAKALELNTPYVAPPGDPLVHQAAGFAKVMCSAVFITGLDPEFAAENVGYFTAPYEVRAKLGKPVVDREHKQVHVAFLRSAAAKERLRPALAAGNLEKTMAAPVTVIIAYDLRFYDKLPKLFPHNPAMRDIFENSPQLIEQTAKRNSSLQGAYLMIAARAFGLDCGPMSGFDNAKVDEEFFTAGKCVDCEQEFFPAGHVKSNFLCNMGFEDPSKLSPRSPRLDFSEACSLL